MAGGRRIRSGGKSPLYFGKIGTIRGTTPVSFFILFIFP
jgi:hypothetical protein